MSISLRQLWEAVKGFNGRVEGPDLVTILGENDIAECGGPNFVCLEAEVSLNKGEILVRSLNGRRGVDHRDFGDRILGQKVNGCFENSGAPVESAVVPSEGDPVTPHTYCNN